MEINISWKICRVCLSESKLKNIFKSALAPSIYECSGVMIKANDSMPDKICCKCLSMLKCAIKFRETCQKSDRYLKDIVQKTKSNSTAFIPTRSNDDIFNALIDDTEADICYKVEELRDTVTQPAEDDELRTKEPSEDECVSLLDDDTGLILVNPSLNSDMYNTFQPDEMCLDDLKEVADTSQASTESECSESIMHQFIQQIGGTDTETDVRGATEVVANAVGAIEINMQNNDFICEALSLDSSESLERLTEASGENVDYDIDDSKSLIEISDDIEADIYERDESGSSVLEAAELHAGNAMKDEEEEQETVSEEGDFYWKLDENSVEQEEEEDGESMECLNDETDLAVELLDEVSDEDEKKDDKKKKKAKKLPIHCEICGNIFRTRNIYHLHMRIHRNDRKHKCEICPKSFNAGCNLVAHMRTHTGEKPYECSYCQRRFSDRSTHIKHERIHTNEKPFVCNICNKAFSLSTSLRTHEKVHSDLKPYNCEVCKKSFKLPHQLKAHLNTQSHKMISMAEL